MKRVFFCITALVTLTSPLVFSADKPTERDGFNEFIQIMEIDEEAKNVVEISEHEVEERKMRDFALKKEREAKYANLFALACKEEDQASICKRKVVEYCAKVNFENDNCKILKF